MDTLRNKFALFLINEVEPRKKKFGHYPPSGLVAKLFRLKWENIISHQRTRDLLDLYYG